MSIAPSALVQLDSACELFSKSAHGFGAQKVLVSLLRCSSRRAKHLSILDDHVALARKGAC